MRFSMSPWESFLVSRSKRIRSPIIMAGIVTWTSDARKKKLKRRPGFFVVTERQ